MFEPQQFKSPPPKTSKKVEMFKHRVKDIEQECQNTVAAVGVEQVLEEI